MIDIIPKKKRDKIAMRKLLMIPSILLISNCFAEEITQKSQLEASRGKELQNLLLKIENLNREEELLENRLKMLLGKLDKSQKPKKKKVKKVLTSKKHINNSDIIEIKVQEGDTLKELAKYFYGDASKATYIYSKDKSIKIRNNKTLTPGTILILPGIN